MPTLGGKRGATGACHPAHLGQSSGHRTRSPSPRRDPPRLDQRRGSRERTGAIRGASGRSTPLWLRTAARPPLQCRRRGYTPTTDPGRVWRGSDSWCSVLAKGKSVKKRKKNAFFYIFICICQKKVLPLHRIIKPIQL